MRPVKVLCEGFHDRAFWNGLLRHFAWKDARDLANTHGLRFARGEHAFVRGGDELVRVVPVDGVHRLPDAVRKAVIDHTTEPMSALIVSLDPDHDAAASSPDSTAQVRTWPTGPIPADLPIEVVTWSSSAPASSTLPRKQTLERLVCAALAAAYPARADAVRRWLDGRPEPPAVTTGKAWTWSFMAGWFDQQGCEAFLQVLWDQAPVRAALIAELDATGLWATLNARFGARLSGTKGAAPAP